MDTVILGPFDFISSVFDATSQCTVDFLLMKNFPLFLFLSLSSFL